MAISETRGYISMKGTPLATTLTVRLRSDEKLAVETHAVVLGLTHSQFLRSAALDAVELAEHNDAKAEFDKDPVVFSAEELAAEFL